LLPHAKLFLAELVLHRNFVLLLQALASAKLTLASNLMAAAQILLMIIADLVRLLGNPRGHNAVLLHLVSLELVPAPTLAVQVPAAKIHAGMFAEPVLRQTFVLLQAQGPALLAPLVFQPINAGLMFQERIIAEHALLPR
jgi:hypothetical protein